MQLNRHRWMGACALGLGLIAAGTAQAAVVDAVIGVAPDDGTSFVLAGIVVDRGDGPVTIDAADLINVRLTAISDVQRINPGPAPEIGQRHHVLEDLDIRSGVINAPNLSFDFLAPVINGPGADILIFDWGTSNDPFDITINGVTMTIGVNSSLHILQSVKNQPQVQAEFSSRPGHLDEFQNNEGFVTATSESSVNVIPLDLSIFGLLEGQAATSLTISNGAGLDVQAILGLPIPEPTSLALLAMGGVMLVARRC